MLIRISLIVAIIAAVLAGALNIVQVRDKIDTLITQRNQFHTERDQVQAQLNTTKKDLAQTQDNLKQTQQDLADAKAARDKAEASAKAETTRANGLADKLAKTSQTLEDNQAKLEAYIVTGLTAQQVTTLNSTLKSSQNELAAVQEENGVLNRTVNNLKNRLAELVGTNYVVTLPATLKGKIVAVDPKWDFVVLNIGGDQGVLDDGEMLVSRDGKLVAKVIVRSVEKDRSIANVMPGWQLGQVFEGDVVTPAHPAS